MKLIIGNAVGTTIFVLRLHYRRCSIGFNPLGVQCVLPVVEWERHAPSVSRLIKSPAMQRIFMIDTKTMRPQHAYHCRLRLFTPSPGRNADAHIFPDCKEKCSN
jgi:hypothetical protein